VARRDRLLGASLPALGFAFMLRSLLVEQVLAGNRLRRRDCGFPERFLHLPNSLPEHHARLLELVNQIMDIRCHDPSDTREDSHWETPDWQLSCQVIAETPSTAAAICATSSSVRVAGSPVNLARWIMETSSRTRASVSMRSSNDRLRTS